MIIQLILTNEEAVTLERALYRRGIEMCRQGMATENNELRERGGWLRLLGDLVKGQCRSQQKFNLKGG